MNKREECQAQAYMAAEDDLLLCDLDANHPGDHWDPEWGMHFRATT